MCDFKFWPRGQADTAPSPHRAGRGHALIGAPEPRAVAVNVEIMRAFVRLRDLLSTHAELARKLEVLEQKYDGQFRVVFEAIWLLMRPAIPEATPARKKIGFC